MLPSSHRPRPKPLRTVVVWGIGLIPAHRRLRAYINTYPTLGTLNAALALDAKAPPVIEVRGFTSRIGEPHQRIFARLCFARTHLAPDILAHEALHAALALADRVGWPTIHTRYRASNVSAVGRTRAGDSREEHLAYYVGRLTACVWEHWKEEGWV